MANDARRPSLRERKQQRTRQTLIDTAMALFAERGFENVTVDEIADTAEVGRTTFFRYFNDKQEVLFERDDELSEAVGSTLDEAARPLAPLGESVENALLVARAGLHVLAGILAQETKWLPVRERLIRDNAALHARNLLKQRRYVDLLTDRLVQHGAGREVATLAAGIAAACYNTAHAAVADDPARLPEAIDAEFGRLCSFDQGVLAAGLAAQPHSSQAVG